MSCHASATVSGYSDDVVHNCLPYTGIDAGLIVAIGLVLLLVGALVMVISSRIPDEYQADLEAPYSDKPLAKEEPYDWAKDGE